MREARLARGAVFPHIHHSVSHQFHNLAGWLLLYAWFALDFQEIVGKNYPHSRRSLLSGLWFSGDMLRRAVK